EVHVPTVAEEAARQVSRERTALTQDHTRLVNQMRGWLATWGSALRDTAMARGGRRSETGPARRCRWKCKGGSPAPPAGSRRSRTRSLSSTRTKQLRSGRRRRERPAPVGAAQRRRDDERVGIAR